jgi:hypothetical protein
MNDTTVRYLPGLAGGVAAYVREVRSELADLPIEDVDDLTGGMEADLTELAADCGGDLAGRLGSPSLYAAELRAAAGLSERVAGTGRQRGRLKEALTHARASFTMLTEQHPWLRSITAFLVTLRPAWWVVRGYLWAWPVWMLLGSSRGIRPHSLKEYVLALVAIVVSVQLGRGWMRQRAGMRLLLVVANTAAVILAFMAYGSGEGGSYTVEANSPPPGVSLDGAQVGNIYAYDSDGKRITGVRLFAQDGRPLDADLSIPLDANGNPIGLDVNGNPVGVVRDSSGAPVMNAYPRAVAGSDPWLVADPANPRVNQVAWTPPMSIVPLAPSSTATSTARTPTATAKPNLPPSVSPTPSSGPSPSVTPSGG